jgi:hypothetical protein
VRGDQAAHLKSGQNKVNFMNRANILRYLCIALGFAALVGAEPVALKIPDVSIGRSLEAPSKVTLADPAPDEGLDVTIRSSDPARLLISTRLDQKGAASAVIKVRAGYTESQEFWLQALDSSGEVTYTADAGHYATAKATASLTPSAIVIVGPLKSPSFITTPHADQTKVTIYSVQLDSSLTNPKEQLIAGGMPVPVVLSNSNPAAGKLGQSRIVMPAGSSSVRLFFQPTGEGDTVLAPEVPEHFVASKKYASVTAMVKKPGMAISDQVLIGQNLQIGGVLAISEIAPPEGLKVTLTSEDPTRLLISPSDKEPGKKSIEVEVPAGTTSARYYLQALDNSGTVSYTASANGFRSRTAVVGLAPAGVILTPESQGPPDEAQVLRKEPPDGVHKFWQDLSKPEPIILVAWTARLDPITHRSADITVQPLRPGAPLEIELVNSHPEIGRVPSKVKIVPGSDHAIAEFKAVSAGSTEISVITPQGFIESANSTMVRGYVRK